MTTPVDGDLPRRPPERRPRAALLERLRRAPATTGLLIVLVVVFLATVVDPALMWRYAKVDARIREGEVWRLVTASFLHGGVLHIAVNAYALAAIGPTVEQIYGRLRLLVVFVVGGAAGFAASTAFVRQDSLGASAGIFALLGILLAFGLRSRERLAPQARRALIREILIVAGINLALGVMVPYVDNAAHIGGFLGGLGLGALLRPR